MFGSYLFPVVCFLLLPSDGARSQHPGCAHDVLVSATFSKQQRHSSETCSEGVWSRAESCLEKVTSWRLGQESRPLDTMQNWTNYWTVRVDIEFL